MNIYKKLFNIQQKLKAPKKQFNKFDNYNYRSCEDILEAVKSLLKENNLILVINDEVIEIIGCAQHCNGNIVIIQTGIV